MDKNNLNNIPEEVLSSKEENKLLNMIKSKENKDFLTHADLKKKYNLGEVNRNNIQVENIFVSDDEVNLAIEESIKDFSDIYEKLAK